MVGDFGWEHEGTKSGVGTVNQDPFKSKIHPSSLFLHALPFPNEKVCSAK